MTLTHCNAMFHEGDDLAYVAGRVSGKEAPHDNSIVSTPGGELLVPPMYIPG